MFFFQVRSDFVSVGTLSANQIAAVSPLILNKEDFLSILEQPADDVSHRTQEILKKADIKLEKKYLCCVQQDENF